MATRGGCVLNDRDKTFQEQGRHDGRIADQGRELGIVMAEILKFGEEF